MNLVLAAGKARTLPEQTFEAMRRLHPILSDLNNLIDKKWSCLAFSIAFAFFSTFFVGSWAISVLKPILEKIGVSLGILQALIYIVLHFGLLFLAGFTLGHLLYKKKIEEKIRELKNTYDANQEWSAAALLYILEFDPQNFNVACSEFKSLKTFGARKPAC